MSQIGLPPVQSLPAGTTTGTGLLLDNGVAKADHSCFIIVGANPLTAGVVTLELSNDGVNWTSVPANMGTPANMATPAGFATAAANSVWMLNVVDMPAQYVRAAVTTTITGGSVTAYVASA